MKSLETRLTLGLTLSLGLVFCGQWLAVRIAIRNMMEASIAGELVEDAEELLAALDLGGQEGRAAQMGRVEPAFMAPHSEHYFEVLVDGARSFSSPSLAGGSLKASAQSPGTSLSRRGEGPQGQKLLVDLRGFEKSGHVVTIAIGVDLAVVERSVDRLLWRYTELTVLMLAILLLLQKWMVRRALSALHRIREEVELIGRGAIPEIGEAVPAEVLPLVHEVNRLSRTMVQRLQRSRETLGNLAHAFKTPLTLLTQSAHDLGRGGAAEATAPILEQVEVLRRRVDFELKRARLAGRAGPALPIRIDDEVTALVRAMHGLYAGKPLEITSAVVAGATFHGDREDVLELIGNLVDNACKYGRNRVAIAAAGVGEELHLTVEDDGPGCSHEALARLTERGNRLDESVAGHGLGLAIASDVVATYGGSMAFSRSDGLGGLRVHVRLPLRVAGG